ncbi:unnamed protein product [Brugia timori]|uniref:Uncharacterized protein n=1 Tax=Brugia timori TaxID=42155 RepID=A0A0R3Q908_9BILA|nr:unnamed protein product [Brugia timori]
MQIPLTRVRDHREVLLHRQRRKDLSPLGHPTQPGMHPAVRRQRVMSWPHDRMAREGLGCCPSAFPAACLAHTVAPQNRQAAALGEEKAQAVEDHGVAVARIHGSAVARWPSINSMPLSSKKSGPGSFSCSGVVLPRGF